jgi:hypothetical protein
MANLIKIKVDIKDKGQVKKLEESIKKKEALKSHVKSDLPLKLFKPLHGGA